MMHRRTSGMVRPVWIKPITDTGIKKLFFPLVRVPNHVIPETVLVNMYLLYNILNKL